MTESPEKETYSDSYIYMFMDASGPGLPVDASSVELTEMLIRHNAFEVEMTDEAQALIGDMRPVADPTLVDAIEGVIKRIRSGEDITCRKRGNFPGAALGVLWGWHVVTRFQWEWRAVKKDWWETLAVADKENRYVILPVQFMLGIAEDKTVKHWPHEVIDAIATSRLPASQPGNLLRLW